MTLITDQAQLVAACQTLHDEEYITVDTEFLRDKSYYPKLCLIQIGSKDHAFAVDPLDNALDLAPVFDIFANEQVTKVFHAARQDLEIILKLSGKIPTPLFDTQVAGMVCGFGAAVSYAKLVEELVSKTVDKSSRFTDWSRRPLSEKQLKYALSDVIYLRPVYEKLREKVEKANRTPWLAEEMEILTNPANYQIDPDTVWKKLNPKSNSRRFLAIIRELAKWRELVAQELDRPRGHVLRDQTLLEIAAVAPKTIEELQKIRGLGKSTRRAEDIIAAIAHAQQLPNDELPVAAKKRNTVSTDDQPLVDLLKVLLKIKCVEHNVAAKLIASSEDLHELASNEHPDIDALHGWRHEVFGQYALALKEGKIALCADGNVTKIIEVG